MSNKTAIAEKIYAYIKSTIGTAVPFEFDMHLNILESEILDSTAIAEMLPWLEETFSIDADPEALTPENFTSLDAIAGFVLDNNPQAGGQA